MATKSAERTALRASGLSKSYGDRPALRDAGFEVKRGELLAVVGPNGAGKTTLLGILAGIGEPDSGTVEAEGEVGWVPQQAALYRRLTVEENLRLFARLEKVDDVDAAVEAMLEQTGLAERRGDQVLELSGGNQQRINIAIGLLAEPAVLLLDEPSAGLDPGQRIRLWEFVSSLAKAGHHRHLLDPPDRGGEPLRRPPAGARRRRGPVRGQLRGDAPGGRRPGRRQGPRGRLRQVPEAEGPRVGACAGCCSRTCRS